MEGETQLPKSKVRFPKPKPDSPQSKLRLQPKTKPKLNSPNPKLDSPHSLKKTL